MGKNLWKLAVPPLICYFLSLSLTQPLGSQVVVKLVCAYDSNHDVNDDDCGSKSIAEKAGWIVTSMFVASSLPSMIMNGNYGRISDLYGRKYITIIPFIGTTIFAVALAFVSRYQPAQYIPILLVSSFINGFCGIYSVVTMGLFTFAADSLTILSEAPEKRSQVAVTSVSVDETGHVSHGLPCASRTAFAYSIMEGAISLTRLLGPTLGGLLTERVDPSFVLALLVAAASTTLGAIWVGLVMPAVSVPTAESERLSDPDGEGGVAAEGEGGVREPDAHFWRHTEAEPVPEHEAPAKEFKFNFLVTFQNIYWLVVTVPTLIPGIRPASLKAKKEEMDLVSGRSPKSTAHQQDVLVHLQSVPYFAVAYFLFFTVLVASDAVLMVVFLINVYDFGPALIGYYVTSEAIAQITSILLVPNFMQDFCIPAINQTHAWARRYFAGSYVPVKGNDGDAAPDSLLIPLFSDIDLVCVGHFARAAYLVAFAAYLHYQTVTLFALLLLLIPAQLVMPRTKALLSNCFCISDTFSMPTESEESPSRLAAADTDTAPRAPLLGSAMSAEQCKSKMFSALSSLEMLASFAAPVIGLLYAATLPVYPGTVFLLLAGLSVVAGGLVYTASARMYFDVIAN